MRFFKILENTRVLATNITNFDFCFNKICSNSDRAELGDVFVCRRGSKCDGHDYIETAHKRGVKTVVCEYITDYLHKNPDLRYIVVEDTSLAEVRMLDNAYGHPAKDMKLIGITGTNGKTSCAYMIKSLFDSAGYKTGLISTIKTLAGDKDITEKTCESEYNSMTTPSPSQLYEYLYKMKEHGTEIVVMEASSHALAQRRLDALHFSLGIFTNLSEDHLDYHKDLTQYMNAKTHLFDLCNIALINTDCKYGRDILKSLPCKAFSYGSKADFSFEKAGYTAKDTSFTFAHGEEKVLLNCPVPGDFTVYNALAAAAAAKIFKIDNKTIKSAIDNLAQIPGRLERVDIPDSFDVYIDYAHTPDALEKVLLTLKRVCRGRLITVFGCGGNREREKRPIMGRIATAVSDITVITSDNPRNEPREKIISEILSGAKRNSNYKVIENRKDAIRYALALAKEGDTLLLAGKGHEDYEITENTKRHFCEKEIIKEFFESKC
ncbi:MAG: UDP-N-acetylmuramoyl-L-alanyl-D-glutamate--2,6-diaminopimelate ligase [Ruminococcaceae bacterium]|nr:UDP-N-acetylmuramoyl-L-alanyl-D-glutamate--2,6-diaminopimelate ligase [Oscillospiraceae bacterium]